MAQLCRIRRMVAPAHTALPLTLLLSMEAYRLQREQPLGRQSAGAGLLEAYLRYGGNRDHQLVVCGEDDAPWFHQQAQRWEPKARTLATGMDAWGDAAAANGAILLPGPGLDEWAWKRMPWGDGAFSLVGMVHTLCSRQVQWGLGQFSASPVRPWDALICTSTAAKAVVEGFLDRQEDWLKHRLEAKQFERPQLPVIPLGVHAEHWAPPGGKDAAQAAARAQLNMPVDAQVVLLAGRLDILTKFHPGPLLRTLGELHTSELPKLHLLIYGEAPNAGMEQLWREGLRECAPELPISWIPGSKAELAGPVRWASDLFVSLADNPQETFGITPLEAMAAELPCLVSDWDGYRDTVTNEVGCRIPTSIVEGLGASESKGLLMGTLRYDQALGLLAQGVAVDLKALREALVGLLNNPQKLKTMGKAGRQRVMEQYAWPVVIEQWRLLLGELRQHRLHARNHEQTSSCDLPHWLPPMAQAYAAYPSTIHHGRSLQTSMHDSMLEEAQIRARGTLDRWDGDLQHQLSISLNTGCAKDARLQGWLLKQGFLDQHPGA